MHNNEHNRVKSEKSGRHNIGDLEHNVGDLEHSVDNPTSLNNAVCTRLQPVGCGFTSVNVPTCWGCGFTSVNNTQEQVLY